jgi:molecular chaperone GrpE
MDEQPFSSDTSPETPPQTALQLEVEQLREYRDKYLRLLAENENARKRLQREKQDSLRHAIADVIAEFLPPLDHLENALKFAGQSAPEVQNWAKGFAMIVGQFKEALANHGVFSFDSEKKPFETHQHEAVEMVETQSYPPGTVIEELTRGYKIGERTLRPARVKVSKAEDQLEQKKDQENQRDEQEEK